MVEVVSTNWPSYQCHKVVKAVRFTKSGDGRCEFHTDNGETYYPVSSMYDKASDGWYLVEYEDGYVSISPPEAFEAGYTLIEG